MGGIFGAMLLAISIPILRPVMLYLGSPELLAFSVLGISMVAVLSGSAPLRGVTAGCLGIMIAMIGSDPQTGTLRWTFDSLYLWDGLPLTPLLLGLFALPELCDLLIARITIAKGIDKANIYKGQWQGVKDCFENWWLIMRCSWIGGGIGSIPGISASVVDWLAYGHALKTEKGASETFGKGDVRGVIASESSNNAKEGGALVPTVAFGVPGSATMAILLGAFLIHGLVPGPDMLTKNLNITYAMVWSVALANILGAGLCYAFSPQFARLATLRYTLILPAVLGIVYIGAFEASRYWGDLYRAAVLRPGRLADEAVQLAAPAAHSRRRAGRHRSSATCSSRSSATALPGLPVRWWRSCSPWRSSAWCGRSSMTYAAKAALRKMLRQLPGADASTRRSCSRCSCSACHRHAGGRRAELGFQRQDRAAGGRHDRDRDGRLEPVQRHVPQAGGDGRPSKASASRPSRRSSRRSTWI